MTNDVLPRRSAVVRLVCPPVGPWLLGLLVCSLPVGVLAAAGSSTNATTTTAPDREHVLFVGMDVLVAVSGKPLPVVQADSHNVQIVREGERMRLPLRGLRNFKTPAEPKISSFSLQLDHVKTTRVFHGANDPARDAIEQQGALDAMQDNKQLQAESGMRTALQQQQALDHLVQSGATVPSEVMQQLQAENTNRMNSASAAMNDAYTGLINSNSSGIGSELADAFDSGGQDALEVSFTVSSPVPVSGAYAVLRTFTRASGAAQPAGVSLRFFGLPPLDAKPRRVSLLEVGLPPGFEIDRFEIHIYSEGRELATNLSNNRMVLTEAEVVKFLVMQHVARNAGASTPVQVMAELVPADLAVLVPIAQRGRTFDVTVDADGAVEKVVLAPRASGDTVDDAALLAALRGVRFLPALLKGKAVTGTGTFALSEVVR